MKVKVIKAFIDKNTRQSHNAGTMYECDKERAKFLASKGFVELGKSDEQGTEESDAQEIKKTRKTKKK